MRIVHYINDANSLADLKHAVSNRIIKKMELTEKERREREIFGGGNRKTKRQKQRRNQNLYFLHIFL